MLFACNDGGTKSEYPVYKINMDVDEGRDFMGLVDSLYYIELEVTDKSIIGEIAHIVIDEYIFLLDRKNQSINSYTKQGQFVSALSYVGDGPGEYIRIDDFFIDPMKKNINVLDGTKNKIISYSFEGKFIEEVTIPLEKGLSKVIIFEGQYYFDQRYRRNSKNESYNLIVMDSLYNIINKEFYYDSYLDMTLGLRRSLSIVSDTLTYMPLYSDIVYNINRDGVISPRYSFDFGKKQTNLSYVFSELDDPMAFIRGLEHSGGIYFLNIVESDSHIFIDYMYEGKNYYSIMDKVKSVVRTGQNLDKGGCKGQLVPLTAINDFFVLPVERHNAPIAYQVGNPDEYNPILMMLKFK